MTDTPAGAETARAADSPLLALIAVSATHGVHLSQALIRRDHALGEGPTDFDTLIRIAERNGLRVRQTKMRWKDLGGLGKALPAIVRLSNGHAMLLTGFRREGAVPVAILRDPSDRSETTVAVDEVRMADAWDGTVLLIKRRRQASDAERPFGVSWLVQQVVKERKLCRDISVAALFLSLFSMSPIFLFVVVVDRVLTYQRESTLVVLAGAIAFILIFDTAFGYLKRYLVAVLSSRISARMSVYAFNKLIGLPIDFFERRSTGEIAYKLNELNRIRDFMTGLMFGAMLDSMVLLFILPLMFWLSPLLTFIALGIGLVMCVVVALYVKPMSLAYNRLTAAEQSRNAFLIESIHGMRTIKSLAIEDLRRVEWDARVAESVRSHTRFQLLSNQPQTILQPLEKAIYAGVLLVGAYMAISDDFTMQAGALVAMTMLSQRLVQPFVQIAQLFQQYEEARGALNMVASVVNTEPEQRAGRQGVRPVIAGQIEFTDVRFRYPGAEAAALDDLNFRIDKGRIIGIMGRSGSGKTTITRLLQGLHRHYEGLIKVDGVDLREIDLAHLRSHVGVVLQDNFLFRGTIRENIMAAHRSATLDEVIRAAQLAGAEEFIDRLPMGYETMIEEGSANLSGGQRQRIAIARALLVDPKVVILDEATSALDPDSEAIVNTNLLRMAEGRTVIVISHRLSSLVNCDNIMVMERGKLVDMGPHAELLNRCYIYSHLWKQQNRNIA